MKNCRCWKAAGGLLGLVGALALVLCGCDLWYKDLKGYVEYWTDSVKVESANWDANPESQRNSSGVHTIATNATVTANLVISNPEGYPLESIVSSAADGPHAVEVSGAAASAVLPLTRVTSSSLTSLAVEIAPFSQVPTPESLKLEHTNFTVKISPTRSENAFQAPNPLALTLRYNTPPRMPLEVVYNTNTQKLERLGADAWAMVQGTGVKDLDDNIYWAYPSGIIDPRDPDYVASFQIYQDGALEIEDSPSYFSLATNFPSLRSLVSPDLAGYDVYVCPVDSGKVITVYAVDGEGVRSQPAASGKSPHAITLNADGGTFGSGGSTLTVYKAANSTITGGDLDVPTMSGFYLSGWSEQPNGTPLTFPLTVSSSSPATLYALWTANPAGGGSGGGTAPPPVADPNSYTLDSSKGDTLNSIMNKIRDANNAAGGGGTYTIVLPAGESIKGGIHIGDTETLNLRITSDPGSPATIDAESNGVPLEVGEFSSVTLENVIVTGGKSWPGGGVKVKGTLTLEAGTVITGNKAEQQGGGGIYVEGGTVIMNGGEIKDNEATEVISGMYAEGGGVYITSGTFTMNGGTISNNRGGGVYMTGGTFTMNDGTISGNSNAYGGSGVNYDKGGTFNHNGGTITDDIKPAP